jgi:hypothetical protein
MANGEYCRDSRVKKNQLFFPVKLSGLAIRSVRWGHRPRVNNKKSIIFSGKIKWPGNKKCPVGTPATAVKLSGLVMRSVRWRHRPQR